MTSLAGLENVGLKLVWGLSLDLEPWQRYQLLPAVSSSDSPLPGPRSPPPPMFYAGVALPTPHLGISCDLRVVMLWSSTRPSETLSLLLLLCAEGCSGASWKKSVAHEQIHRKKPCAKAWRRATPNPSSTHPPGDPPASGGSSAGQP